MINFEKTTIEIGIPSPLKILHITDSHLYFSYESRLRGGTMQYVTDRGDSGNAREITII